VVLLCTACAPAATTRPVPASSTAATALCTGLSERGQRPAGPRRHVPATIGISWDQASKDAAVDTAEKAMTDFARPGMEDKQWANDLARWLTPQATADYSAVDPANIPARRSRALQR
jgi:hypothetical protein